MRRLAALLLLIAPSAVAQSQDDWSWLAEHAPAAWEALEQAAAYCARETGGVLEIDEAAVQFTDLDGDAGEGPRGGPDDVVVDFNAIFCSRAMTLWAGTGGSPVTFILDGEVSATWFGFDWEVERMGPMLPAIILLSRHGSACDGYGTTPCVQAIVAVDGAFSTVRYPDEWEGFPTE